MDRSFEQARDFFLQGLAHYQAGRFAQAEQQFAASLALVPGRPSTLTNLGAARIRLGRFEEAIADLEQAIAQEPGNAEALGHLGAALAQQGGTAQALACFDRALAADSGAATVWMLRGSVLRELGRHDEAAESFRRSIAAGGDEELNRYYLAGVAPAEVPRSAPRGYVESLFDQYAQEFEGHVTQALHYDAPAVLCERLAGRHVANAVDLGCGTGLAGALLRPLADRLVGVDLSAGMLAQAQKRGVYDALVHADLAQFLAGPTERFGLALAADVFIYVGALEPVFEGLAPALERGAVLAFTVEEAQGEPGLQLRPSLRYAHSESYLLRLAEAHGFRVLAQARRPVRHEQGQPIAGLFAWWEKK